MDWLKEILEKAVITDGRLDVEAVMKQVSEEFPKHNVPKSDFDAKVKELETASRTITELKESKEGEGNEELQKRIAEYETEVANLKKEAVSTAKTYALKEQLSQAGVVDPDYLIYKAGGIEKFKFDKENKPVEVEEILKPYRENGSMKHLFKEAERQQSYNPQNGETGFTGNPFAKETYNMTEQAKLFRSNPEQARVMAAAAGVTI